MVLYRPEIPPNTGNVIRLCANTGAMLHLVHPLGFAMDDRRLRRAGLDYHEWARVCEHARFSDFLNRIAPARLFMLSTRAARRFHEARFRPGDAVVFGPETSGLPSHILEAVGTDRRLRLPMVSEGRSLNLSNAVAIVVFEVWRQWEFIGARGV